MVCDQGDSGLIVEVYASTVWCFPYAVSEQLSAQYGAVKMLHSRVRLVLDYLKAVQSGMYMHNPPAPLMSAGYPVPTGELPCHPQILREASALCNQLPVLDKVLFDKDFQSVSFEVTYEKLVPCTPPQGQKKFILQ